MIFPLSHAKVVGRIFRQQMGIHSSRSTLNPLKMEVAKVPQTKTERIISETAVVIFSKSYCPYCKAAKQRMSDLHVQFLALELDQTDDGDQIQAFLAEKTGQKTVPSIFIGQKHIGGNSDLQMIPDEQLLAMIKDAESRLQKANENC